MAADLETDAGAAQLHAEAKHAASGFQDKAEMKASALVKGNEQPTADQGAAAGYQAIQRGQRVYVPGAIN